MIMTCTREHEFVFFNRNFNKILRRAPKYLLMMNAKSTIFFFMRLVSLQSDTSVPLHACANHNSIV
jgi:hypothetical protein